MFFSIRGIILENMVGSEFMELRLILSLIVALFIVIFSIQNSASVVIKLLFIEFNVSLAVVILISTILGAIIVMLMWAIQKIQLNKKIKEQAKKIENLEKETLVLQKEAEGKKINDIEIIEEKEDKEDKI